MKPPRFTYLAPDSAETVVRLLREYGGDARCLAGGQSLIPLLNYRLIQPAALIDLKRCPGLDFVRREGSCLIIGAMTRQAAVEHSALAAACCPLLVKTMMYLGSPAIRNRGTIGGTIAHADRTAELPAVALVLEAEMIAQGPDGLRIIQADKFFIGDLTTALRADEMVRELRFPVSPEGSLCAFVETGNRHHDLALAGVAVYIGTTAGGEVSEARVACMGIGARPVRLGGVERSLFGRRLNAQVIRDAAKFALDGITVESDSNASAAYRLSVLPGLVTRALRQANGETGP